MGDRGNAGWTRRGLLKSASAGAAILSLPIHVTGAFAQNPTGERLHGLSAFGELKYPADFEQFDYVNVDAPKGGRFHITVPSWLYNQNVDTFNTLNTFVLRGDAPPRMERCFDTLMASALDEPDSIYGLVAQWVEVSQDRNTHRFGLRPEARFHDGSALTARDVAFSMLTLKDRGHPALAEPLRALSEARVIDDQTIELVFDGTQSARTILATSYLPILSEAYYADRDFEAGTLEPPLSSGPWRVGRFESGRFLEYERVGDHWAADLPVRRGSNNFDILRIEFFADRRAAFEAFKKGDVHWRREFTSTVWASEYNFPAVTDKSVIKGEFPGELRPSMQAWALNQRRPKFQDRATREAIGLCFDFEWTNANLMFGLFERRQSMFETSDFKAEGAPSEAELALIDSLAAPLPEGIRGEVPLQPVSDGSGRDRALLRRASELLASAGWKRIGQSLTREGEALSIEFILNDPIMESRHAGMVGNLRALGVDATMRILDPAQFSARMNDFDYDVMMMALSFAPTPGADSLRQLFSSAAADQPGSRNLTGTKDPAIDEVLGIIEKVGSRDELVTAMRVLDRLLRHRIDWIPNWFAPNHWVAYWDMFGFKEPKPDYDWPVESLWWYDEERARAIGRA
jgi:microcin C transport system substrate-binding protein